MGDFKQVDNKREHSTIPALVFHSVRKGAGKDLHALEPARFEDVMVLIMEKFGGTLSMKDIADYDSSANQTGVLVTFDDGYEDHYKVVLPILRKYNAKATFFLLPKYFGQQNLWDHRSQVILKHLSVRQAKELQAEGHTLGSHGLTHNSLLKFNDYEVEAELKTSKNLLEKMLEIKVDCFAYPYGDFNQNIVKLASSVYKYSFATNKEMAPKSHQLRRAQIRRGRILSNMSLKEIEALIIGFDTYE